MPKKRTTAPAKTQRDKRQKLDVGHACGQVTSVADWHQQGQFKNDDEARGAFRLAHLQGLEGMGPSTVDWMGLTQAQFDAWMRDDELPSR
jgi:hypothetical protein